MFSVSLFEYIYFDCPVLVFVNGALRRALLRDEQEVSLSSLLISTALGTGSV
jgi:hypothetical protein